ncbi:hypothetical protein MKMG_02009 [Methanogenium sp. MK-MG]|nr:hypothetical protein MKMG_02009 [Methanogenium sp. MK-MG]
MLTISSACTIFRGTLSGWFSSRWMAESTSFACIVEKVVWPVFIAWKRVCASLPRTSPTMIYSGRWRIAAFRRSNISILDAEVSVIASRVTDAIQLS